MLRFCAASRTSVFFGTPPLPSPDLLITELSTNPAQATIYIAVFAKRPNLRRTGGATVKASRIGDFECSNLSMTMCSNRMESVMIGVTLLSIPMMTTVRGSRVVEGESHEHSFLSGFFVGYNVFVSSHWQPHLSQFVFEWEVTYQSVNINEGDLQAKYEKEKA